MIIDAHCHLDLFSNPFEIAKRCLQKDIYILSVTTTPKAWYGTTRLASDNPKIDTCLGFHPQLAHKRVHELELFDTLLPKVKFIGEIGLDGSADFKEHWKVQRRVFQHILNSINNAGGRIMSIHSRASVGAVLTELKQNKNAGIPILHWFTGNHHELREAIDLGCWFSIGPAMLNSIKGQEVVAKIPRGKLLPESDAPFMEVKKQKIMPWDTMLVCEKLAQIWGAPLIEVEEQLFENFKKLKCYSF